MNVLFAMAHPYLPQFSGGVQSSSHEMTLQLIKRGVNVSVAANLLPNDLLALRSRMVMKVFRRKTARDLAMGYPVYRSWAVWNAVDELVEAVEPDVVVVQPRHAVR